MHSNDIKPTFSSQSIITFAVALTEFWFTFLVHVCSEKYIIKIVHVVCVVMLCVSYER